MRIKYVPIWEFLYSELVGKNEKCPGVVRKFDFVQTEPEETVFTGDILVYISFGFAPKGEAPRGKRFGYRGDFMLRRVTDSMKNREGMAYGYTLVFLEECNEKQINPGTLAMIKLGATEVIKDMEIKHKTLPLPSKPQPPEARPVKLPTEKS